MPPKKPRSLLDIVFLAALGVLGLITSLGALGWLIMSVTGSGTTSAPTAPAARVLQRIALQQSWTALFVCPSEHLHHCRLRYGTAAGADLLATDVEIRAPASCDDQEGVALRECTAADVEYDSADYHRCEALHGVFPVRGLRRGDIRDTHLAAGVLRLDCDEGYADGTFSDPRF